MAELQKEVDALTSGELAQLSAYIARRDDAGWDAEMDRDFATDGRLRSVLDTVRTDIQQGRLEEMP